MSEEPLTPATTKMIVVAENYNQLREEALNYNLSGGDAIFHLVDSVSSLNAAMLLPVDTPWCILGGPVPSQWTYSLGNRFGGSKTFADCLQTRNNEYAIDPKKLRG